MSRSATIFTSVCWTIFCCMISIVILTFQAQKHGEKWFFFSLHNVIIFATCCELTRFSCVSSCALIFIYKNWRQCRQTSAEKSALANVAIVKKMGVLDVLQPDGEVEILYRLELVSKELNHFGVIAGLFRQIGGHSSRFVLFCSFWRLFTIKMIKSVKVFPFSFWKIITIFFTW